MTRLKIVAIGAMVFCVVSACAGAETTAQDVEFSPSQAIIPSVCPQDKGPELPPKPAAVKSEAICIPAAKTHLAEPCKSDIITTPGPSCGRTMNTRAPEVSSAPVPDIMREPITLEQALEIAFKNSPEIQAALSNVESSRGSVEEARAQFNPTFNATLSATLQGPITQTVTSGGQTVDLVSSPDNIAGLTVTLPLDVSHQLRYSSDIAKYQFQAEYLSMVSVSEQLIVDVKSAYYDLLRACGQMAVNQASVDDAKQSLDIVSDKFKEGTVAKYDVTSAEVNLDNLNQQLIASQNDVRVAQSSLNAVLGIDVNNPTQVAAIDVPVDTDSVNIPECVNQAYAKRPEIKSAQIQVTLSQTNVNLQKTGMRPSLSLSGGPSYDFNPSGTTTDKASWQAGLTLNVPLCDGGVTKAKVRQARAEVQNSLASLNKQKIAVAKEVRKAALDLQNAALRTKTTAHAVKLAEDALAIANDRYSSGVAVWVEVTNAQSDLAQARYNYVDAQFDYANALAQLQKATASQPELNQLQLLADKDQVKVKVKEAQS
ncbi:TolC family protein [bacterium]|nr:TolC family protein [bacterium]